MSGMSVSILVILWSETDQPNFLHTNTCHNVQTKYTNTNIDEKRCFDCFVSVLAGDCILLSD